MTLSHNPIFLTQKRLVHRAGVLAAILIAALIGLSLLSGLIAYLADPNTFGFRSPAEAGRTFYGWVLGVEVVVLVVGGFSRISRALAEDRKAGLWDSNRLTPLRPPQLLVGYWWGAALREFYMGSVLAIIGLAIVLIGRLPLTLWLGTQMLAVCTALFFGLIAALTGMAVQRPQGGIVLLLAFVCLQTFSRFQPRFMITNFLLPIYGIAYLFDASRAAGGTIWSEFPEIFGLPVHPVLISLSLQLIVGIFLWRAAVRKTANPFQPLLQRWEAVALFGVLTVAQHGLLWSLWRGQFGLAGVQTLRDRYGAEPMLAIVHCGTIMVGTVVLALASPQPERVRIEALRTGTAGLQMVFSRSAAALGLALAAVAGAALLSQCAFSMTTTWKAFVVAFGNVLDCFLVFPLLLEFCRLRFHRRAPGFVALGLFSLCALPFVLAAVFSNGALGRFSLLSPGAVALSSPASDELNQLLVIVLAHFGIVLLLLMAWRDQWRRLLKQNIP